MDDQPRPATGPQKVAIVAALLAVTIWVIFAVISVIGMSTAEIGPAGDPDATDGWWFSAIDCAVGVVNASISAIGCVVAVRWKRTRPQLAVKLLVPMLIPLAVLVLPRLGDVHITNPWLILLEPLALAAYVPILLMVIALATLALQKPSQEPEEPKD